MFENTKKKLKINLGLIGTGNWGKNYIATINKINHIELVAILKSNQIKPSGIKSNCKVFTKYEDFISFQKFDGIIIASPPNTHCEIASKLILEKIPIIIEKPLTTKLIEAKSLLKLAQQNKGIVLVDHVFLYHSTFRLIKKYITDTNNINSIESIGGNKGPYRRDVTPLWDWGPHDIAMCLKIMESVPIEIKAEKISSKNNSKISENIKINLVFENKTEAKILIGNNFLEKKRKFTLYNKQEIISFNPFIQNELICQNIADKKIINFSIRKNEYNFNKLPLNNLLDHFYNLIYNGESNLSDLRLGVEVTKILDSVNNLITK